ncbi:hypothetical protein cyc_06411 [Cyclospora cayetanensis]|uniref:Uncharacterized protein n=1 Tax=Cyclospora cayetanensis TaxID=88456 RepID=A0A1D3CTA3_9EIME|nr:hypothetical protein cyc_06411 [Cyclospora cayetanensis]
MGGVGQRHQARSSFGRYGTERRDASGISAAFNAFESALMGEIKVLWSRKVPSWRQPMIEADQARGADMSDADNERGGAD